LKEDKSKGGITGCQSSDKRFFGWGMVEDVSSTVSMTTIKTDNKRPDPLPLRHMDNDNDKN